MTILKPDIKKLISELQDRDINSKLISLTAQELNQILAIFQKDPSRIKSLLSSDSKINLERIDFSGQDLSLIDFSIINFNGCVFHKCKLNANTIYIIISRAYKVDITASDLSDIIFSYVLKSRRMGSNFKIRPNFSKMNLKEVNYHGSNLENAIFADADLRKSNLSMSDLKNAIFDNANITDADFSGAKNCTPIQFVNSRGIEYSKGFNQEFLDQVQILRDSEQVVRNLYDNKLRNIVFNIAIKYPIIPTNIMMSLFPDYTELLFRSNLVGQNISKIRESGVYNPISPMTSLSSRDSLEKPSSGLKKSKCRD